ncbi:hypothetical protein [Streptomyces mirabilis]|uniref:hypothetical protein n=1 Tax=Streptomyces mirabilis TaxID=68239 RepID=UPI00368209ED
MRRVLARTDPEMLLLDLPAAERDRIDRQIAGLRSVRNRLDDMITEARKPDSGCPCLPAEPLDSS